MTKILMRRQQNFLIRFGLSRLLSHTGIDTLKTTTSDLTFSLLLFFERHFAEMGGYFQSTTFEETVMNAKEPITFYDSVTGKPLFVAPVNRSAEQFIAESKVHGW